LYFLLILTNIRLVWDLPPDPSPKKQKVCVKRKSIGTPIKNSSKEEQVINNEEELKFEIELKKTPKKMEQVFIDIGQKNFFQTQCGKCGMYFVAGDEIEEKLHNEYHKKNNENSTKLSSLQVILNF
jgi:hypothetical protein